MSLHDTILSYYYNYTIKTHFCQGIKYTVIGASLCIELSRHDNPLSTNLELSHQPKKCHDMTTQQTRLKSLLYRAEERIVSCHDQRACYFFTGHDMTRFFSLLIRMTCHITLGWSGQTNSPSCHVHKPFSFTLQDCHIYDQAAYQHHGLKALPKLIGHTMLYP